MKTLTTTQLNTIIKNIPIQTIEFTDWDFNDKGIKEGSFEDNNYHIETELFLITMHLRVSQLVKMAIPACACHSKTCSIAHDNSKTSYLDVKKIFLGEDEFELTEEQHYKLNKAILKTIKY